MIATTVSRQGIVTDRTTGNELGSVERIEWPTSTNGHVKIERRWEARRPHEFFANNPFGFPTFPTRAAAVAHLAR